MRHAPIPNLVLALATAAFLAGCGDTTEGPLEPGDLTLQAAKGGEKGGNGGGGGGNDKGGGKGGGDVTLVADIVPDADFGTAETQLASTCPGTVTSGGGILFGHTGCLIVSPTGSSYDLTDDISFEAKSKRGAIEKMRLTGQDVVGDEGIMHETDFWVYDPPVTVAPDGTTTVHVHLDGVEVWRLSGHLRGKRVELIGTIAIGDIVYRPAQ